MKIQSNIPKLRFPGFRNEWKVGEFGDLFTFKPTNSLSRDKLTYVPDGIMNIHYGDIHTKFSSLFDIRAEDVPYIKSDVDLSRIPLDNYCVEGDLIIADASEDYADIGKTIEIIELSNKRVLAGLHTMLARPTSNTFASGFASYLMKSIRMRKQIMVIAQGTKVLGLSSKQLSNTFFPFPSLPEQTKIASFLSKVDEKITQLKKKKELLEQYKKGMMQKIFSQEVRFKDEKGEEFPDWEERKLGDVSNIKRGSSPRPISDKKWFSNASTIGWVRISDVTKSKNILRETEQYLSEEGIRRSRLVKEGNLIMSICATIGKPIYTGFDVCIHDGFVVFDDLKLDHQYLYFYLDFIKENWYKYGQPGTQVNLNTEIVSNESFFLPTPPEQTKIANFLSAIDKKINHTQAQIDKAEQWKKGLLQQMFV